MLLPALRANTTLTTLNLSGNCLTLSLGGLLSTLAARSVLTDLDLSSNRWHKGEPEGWIPALQNHPTLQALNMMSNDLEDDEMIPLGKALRTNTRLISLNLSHNQATTTGLDYLLSSLSGNTTLSSLEIGEQPGFPSHSMLVSFMRTNNTITQLDLRSAGIDQLAMKSLVEVWQHHPSLTSLNLSHNPDSMPFTHMGQLLRTNSLLKTLFLNENHLRWGSGSDSHCFARKLFARDPRTLPESDRKRRSQALR